MAQAYKLSGFDDLAMIGKYAERFGLDPDEVYHKTSFDTLINFLWMWKENDEYSERYFTIWQTLNSEAPVANEHNT